jgi:pimeloyl-ACP methyl ester carboxylesterase
VTTIEPGLEVVSEDGRKLDVASAGPEDGTLVLLHDGTPTAGHLYEPLVAAGAKRGLRHASYARPGYRGSDRNEGRSVADCIPDVLAVADALGADRFHVLGWSGGGPHCLATAALLPERVLSAATIGGVAPADAAGLDWTAGMGEENVAEFGAANAGDDELRGFLDRMAAGLAEVSGEELHRELGGLVSEVDREALTGDFAEHMAATFHGAVSSGIWGWFDDDMAFVRDWGFDLGAVERPVAIWQGGEDRFVPYAHGEWLAGHVAGAEPHLLPDEGHLSLGVVGYGEVLAALVTAADGRS